jgi:hypothetical protein
VHLHTITLQSNKEKGEYNLFCRRGVTNFQMEGGDSFWFSFSIRIRMLFSLQSTSYEQSPINSLYEDAKKKRT